MRRLLERKQKEKICVHNIPEGGGEEWIFKSGGKPLEHRLITGLDQGRQACQSRSVPDYSPLTAKSEFKCPGVGRSRDTPVCDRDVKFRRMDISQNNGASAPPAEEQVQRGEGAATGGNPVEGNPSAGNMTPQAQTHTAQNTAQGDDATPLETGLRLRGEVENQRADEAKAARKAALASFNRKGGRRVSETPSSSSNA